MKEEYLKTTQRLFVFMDYAKQYIGNYIEDPITVVGQLYELNNFVSVELAQNIEKEIYRLEKIQDEDPDILINF